MIPIGDVGRRPVFPIAVYLLVAANVWAFVHELGAANPDRFVNAFAAIPYDVTHDVVLAPPSPPIPALTLLTSMFLHGSIWHIGFNMLFLLVFGPRIELMTGHVRFLAFYLACGLAGGAAQVWSNPGSHVPAIGASGAIAGVLGAYLVHFPFSSIRTIVPIGCFPLFLRLPALLVIGVWAAAQFFNGWEILHTPSAESQGGTAYFAHIGGFCAGVLLVGLFRIRAPGTGRYRYHY